MKKIIVSEHDITAFLSYCVSWGFNATCINKVYPFQDRTFWQFVFKLNKPLAEIDLINIKNNAPSVELYYL